MEVLIITYGIAWLLLLSFSLYMQFTEKEKIFRRDVWLVWLLPLSYCWDCFCLFLFTTFGVAQESVLFYRKRKKNGQKKRNRL